MLELTAKSRGSALSDLKKDEIKRRNLAECPKFGGSYFVFQPCEGIHTILNTKYHVLFTVYHVRFTVYEYWKDAEYHIPFTVYEYTYACGDVPVIGWYHSHPGASPLYTTCQILNTIHYLLYTMLYTAY